MHKQQTRVLPHLVCSIISRPYAVVDEEISRQGILPMTAPVKPYTLLALTWPSSARGHLPGGGLLAHLCSSQGRLSTKHRQRSRILFGIIRGNS